MIDEDFISRIENITKHYGLSTAAFADRIGVQRSGISHLMSGRNKPSLDFVMKIINAWPEIDLYWLLTGKGNLIKDTASPPVPVADLTKKNNDIISKETKIKKIVCFYSDGTFTEHLPQKGS